MEEEEEEEEEQQHITAVLRAETLFRQMLENIMHMDRT